MKKIQNIIKNTYAMLIIIFIISFLYMSFFSDCVPFFFDNHEFHTSYVKMQNTDLISQMFHLNTQSLSSSPRPVKAFLTRTLFNLYQYNYCPYRTVYSIIYALLIVVLFVLGLLLFKKKSIAVFFSLYLMTNFPAYIQTMAYGPHIYGELFKILAIIFFIKDIQQEKTSYLKQILIYFLSLFAVRSYISAFSIAAILPLFTIFYNHKKFVKYIPLFILIILIQFPVTFNMSTNTEYSPNIWSIKHVFFNNFLENMINPIPNYSSLYYLSFSGILSFFGIWLIIVVFVGTIITWKKRNIQNVKGFEQKVDYKLLFSISIVWMICELPSYIFLPEHAIRYIFPLFIPFSIFVTILIYIFLKAKYKKYAMAFVLIMLAGAMLVNFSYVYAFRAGWGSSFIGFENTMDYFASIHDQSNIGVLYNAASAAAEYKYINKSSSTYDFGIGIDYIKAAKIVDFSEESINERAAQYERFYVLKRITSISKTQYPEIDFDTYKSLNLVYVVEGYDEYIFFDRINRVIMKILGISYNPNVIYIYEKEDKNKKDR